MGDLQQFRLRLHEVLGEEVASARALKAALASEKEAVGGFDAERLDGETAGKQALVAELQARSAARIDLMTRQGFAAGQQGVRDCLAALAPCAGLAALFDELGHLARACYEENRLVGRMINRRRQFIAGALSSLGAAAPWQYGGNGKSLAADPYRRIGRA